MSMRRPVLSLVLAAVGVSCAGGSTAPSATPAVPALPLAWSGTAKYAETQLGQRFPGTAIQSFEGAVTWQKDDRPDPALPAGSVRYALASSDMRIVVHADGIYAHHELDSCATDGEIQRELPPVQGETPAETANWESRLVVSPDGAYWGEVHSEVFVPATRVCPGGSGRLQRPARMDLYIRGNVIEGRRLQGEMTPDRFADTTMTGSWDFTRR